MSWSRAAEKHTSPIAFSSPSPSPSSQQPKSHFFPSASSSSSSSATMAELNQSYTPLKQQQRRQKRSKDQGRWFPTLKPRYNSDGKKLSQGSSYPYPRGGNRLPLAIRDDKEVVMRREVDEAPAVQGGEEDHESCEILERDSSHIPEAKKEESRGKGKGKEKVEAGRDPHGTRATISSRAAPDPSPDRCSNGSPNMTRREPLLERLHHGQEQEPGHPHARGPLEEDFNFKYLYQQREDDECEINYYRLDEPPDGRPPFCAEQLFYPPSPPDSHLPIYELGEPLLGSVNYPPKFLDEYYNVGLGIQAAAVQPPVLAMGPFAGLRLDEVMKELKFLQHNMGSPFLLSTRYYPWTEYGTARRGGLPDHPLEHYLRSIAELKRTILQSLGSSFPDIEASEQLMNDSHAEHSRLMLELSVLVGFEGPLLRLLEATRMQYWDGLDDLGVLALEECDRVAAYRRILLARLREVEDEIDQGLDMDRLSLEEEDEHYQPPKAGKRQCHHHRHSHSNPYASLPGFEGRTDIEDEKQFIEEAKTQLEEYNKHWTEILSRPASTSPSSSTSTEHVPPIPIPYPPPLRSSRDPTISPTTSDSQAWTAHAFFCHAFNMSPRLEPPPPSSPLSPPQFAFSAAGSRESQLRGLTGLRKQLKMEKVRWHEDRLKAVFGAGAAREERAKGVWSAVIDLKRGVDEALELLERG